MTDQPKTTDDLISIAERAFKDGLAYATICEVTDPDEAWRTSNIRQAALRALPAAAQGQAEVCPTCNGWTIGLVTGQCKCAALAPVRADLDALVEIAGGDVIALVDPEQYEVEPQLAYANGWNAALRAQQADLRAEVERLRDAIQCAYALVCTPIARRKLGLDANDERVMGIRAALNPKAEDV